MVSQLARYHEIHVLCNYYDKGLIPRVCQKSVFFHKIKYYEAPRVLRYLFPLYHVPKNLRIDRYDCVINNGVGNSIIQDILIAQSCHKAWLINDFKSGRIHINPLNLFVLFIENYNYKQGHYRKIISISHLLTKSLIETYSIPDDDIVTIHSGVNVEEFRPSHERTEKCESLRKSLGLRREDFLVLFVGNEFERKGLEVVIRALSIAKEKVQDLKLIVVGKDNPKKYVDFIRNHNLEKDVIFMGLLGGKILRRIYSCSDVLVFPTRYDAFGLVILEAMASGLPVITSRYAGASEIITTNKDGIVINSLNPVSYASEIIRLYEDATLRQKLSRHSVKTAQNYTWDKVIEKVRKVVEKV